VPDVADGDEASDQATVLGAGIYRYAAYGRGADCGEGLAFGNAILSAHPIVEHQAFELPGRESGEVRGLLYALVSHPAGALPVFVTHLNWKLHHGAVRVRQVKFLCDKVFELAPVDDSRLPPVVMGDFNAEPESDEIRYLRGLATLEGASVYFADAWAQAGDGTPGHTFDRRNRFAAVAHEPSRRIDYIFVRGPDAKLRGEPLETRLAFATSMPGPEGDVWPSDHFGVVADLSAEPSSWR
jgi:endonuclease/exonuclease/phosphatase family metal-dependent hydrolase